MAKFRLAVFNTQPPHLYSGGVERRILEITKRIQNEAQVTVYSGKKAGFTQPITVDCVKFVPYHSTDRLFPLDNWAFNRSVTRNAGAIEADVYEAHAVSAYGLPKALAKLGTDKPFVHVIHGVLADEYEQAKVAGYDSFRSRLANYFMGRLAKLEEQAAQQATLIVTISKYSLQNIKNNYDVDMSKVRIVPNGVDTAKFQPRDQAVARQRLSLGKGPVILFVGSLIPRKGLSYLVSAAREVVKSLSDAKFLIIGEGPLKKQLIADIEKAGLSRNFLFLGSVKSDELTAIYNCADVFVLPSIQEGQGIVLLEAQASGLPVVAFDIGGVNEAVSRGETGLLVEERDTDELATALLKLLQDDELRAHMAANAYRFITDNFSWDKSANSMLTVYTDAMNLKGNR